MMKTQANKKQRGLGKGLDQLLTSSSELVEKTIATSGADDIGILWTFKSAPDGADNAKTKLDMLTRGTISAPAHRQQPRAW